MRSGAFVQAIIEVRMRCVGPLSISFHPLDICIHINWFFRYGLHLIHRSDPEFELLLCAFEAMQEITHQCIVHRFSPEAFCGQRQRAPDYIATCLVLNVFYNGGMRELIRNARDFALEAHQGQERKYVGGPYSQHLQEVYQLVDEAHLSEAAMAAAWLHDVCEDCGTKFDEIDDEFGIYVGALVRDLTNTPELSSLSPEERKAKDIEQLRFASSEAQSIKCADLISNISTIVERAPDKAKSYVPAHRKVLDVLTRAKPELLAKAQQVMALAEQALAPRA